MTRGVALLVGACLAGAVAGALAFSASVLRDALQAEVRKHDAEAARLLALAVSAAHADPQAAAGVLASAFDPARHVRIRLIDPQGRILVDLPRALESEALDSSPSNVEDAGAGVAHVSVQARLAGQVHVFTRPVAWQSPWLDAVGVLALGLSALGLTLLAILALGMQRSRQDLLRLKQATRRLGGGEPLLEGFPLRGELATVGEDLLAASRGLSELREQLSRESESVQRAAHTDALTGLYNRAHFRNLLRQALEVEPHPNLGTGGSLLIVRLRRLQAMNLRVGHDKVDGFMCALAGVINAYPARVTGAFAGRLNGSDFGLYLPAPGVALSTAEALCSIMRSTLAQVDPAGDLAIGAVEGLHWGSTSRALAAADEALARAEVQGAFPIVVTGPPAQLVHEAIPDDGSWRQRIAEALDSADVRMREAPVFGLDGGLEHLECMLQFSIGADGSFEDARPRLALDTRSLLTRRVDLASIRLALLACARDGVARCVRLAMTSAEDPEFVHEVTRLMESHGDSATRLRLEVQADPTSVLRWLRSIPTWRARGVGFAAAVSELELGPWAQSAALGLQHVTVDAARLREVAADPARLDAWRQALSILSAAGVSVLVREAQPGESFLALRPLGAGGVQLSASAR